MNQYREYVTQVQKLLVERKVCLSSRNSHKRCYSEFEQYMDQLEEFIQTGTIIQDHLLLTKPTYDKLSDYWKKQMDEYLTAREKNYTKRSFEIAKIYCAEIFLILSDRGAKNFNEISYEDIVYLYQEGFHCIKETWYIIMSHARQLFRFFSEQKKCPMAYSMLFDETVFKNVTWINKLPPETELRLHSLNSLQPICTAEDLPRYMEELSELYIKNHYSYTIMKTLDHTIRMLYVFLSMNELHYSPDISFIWYEYEKKQMGNSCLAARRVLAVLSRYVSGEPVVFEQKLYPLQYLRIV